MRESCLTTSVLLVVEINKHAVKGMKNSEVLWLRQLNVAVQGWGFFTELLTITGMYFSFSA